MSWSESVFKFVYKRIYASHGSQDPSEKQTVYLKDLRKKLQVFAGLIYGRSLHIGQTDGIGGLEGKLLLLPAQCSKFQTSDLNALYYIHRVCRYAPDPLPGKEELLLPLWKEWESRERKTSEQEWFDGPFPKHGSHTEYAELDEQSQHSPEKGKQNSLSVRLSDRPENVSFEEKEDVPISMLFERTKTLEEYSTGQKNLDGSDETSCHSEALSELKLGHVIRTHQSSETRVECDSSPDFSNASDFKSPTNEQRILYPEWHADAFAYRPSWCSLYEERPCFQGGVLRPPIFFDARKNFSYLLNSHRTVKNQVDGQDLDIDAVVRWRASLKNEPQKLARVYLADKRVVRDWSLLILLDSSQSTDAFIRNKRVLDVLKNTVEKIVDPIQALSLPLAVCGFYSQTRHHSRFVWVKDFEECWDAKSYSVLNSLEPQGYSRLGPALRHATKILSERRERKRILLLLSDCKPTDFDVYEGNYGVEDVRKAVEKARTLNLIVQACIFSQSKRPEHERMFGRRIEVLTGDSKNQTQILGLFKRLLV